MSHPALSPDVLKLDLAAEADRIGRWMTDTLAHTLHRRGVVVAISGGSEVGSHAGQFAAEVFS